MADKLKIKLFTLLILTMTVFGCSSNSVIHLQTEPSPRDIKVVSYNILYDYENNWESRKKIIHHFLLNESPDIVGLQEVKSANAEFFSQQRRPMEWLISNFSGYHLIGDEYFNPILIKKNRFEILETGLFWHSLTPQLPRSNQLNAYVPRNSVWATVYDMQTSTTFMIINSHLSLRSRANYLGSQLIVKHSRNDIPVILTGDFNRPSTARGLRYIRRQGFVDATRGLPATFRSLGNTSADLAIFKIDYILTRGFTVVESYTTILKTGSLHASDHYPVVAIVRSGYPEIFR